MTKEKRLPIRLTDDEKNIITENAKRNGFRSVSEYLRFLGMNVTVEIKQK